MKKKYTLYNIVKILESYVSDLRTDAKINGAKEDKKTVQYAEEIIGDLINNHLFILYASYNEAMEVVRLQEEELERVVKLSYEILENNKGLSLDRALELAYEVVDEELLEELMYLGDYDDDDTTIEYNFDDLFGDVLAEKESKTVVKQDNSDKPSKINQSLLKEYKGKHPIEYLQKVIHDKIQKKTIGHSVRAFINAHPEGFERNEIEAVIKYKMYPEEITLFALCNSLGLEYNTIAKLYEENA